VSLEKTERETYRTANLEEWQKKFVTGTIIAATIRTEKENTKMYQSTFGPIFKSATPRIRVASATGIINALNCLVKNNE
jgi:hypothetical protein